MSFSWIMWHLLHYSWSIYAEVCFHQCLVYGLHSNQRVTVATKLSNRNRVVVWLLMRKNADIVLVPMWLRENETLTICKAAVNFHQMSSPGELSVMAVQTPSLFIFLILAFTGCPHWNNSSTLPYLNSQFITFTTKPSGRINQQRCLVSNWQLGDVQCENDY